MAEPTTSRVISAYLVAAGVMLVGFAPVVYLGLDTFRAGRPSGEAPLRESYLLVLAAMLLMVVAAQYVSYVLRARTTSRGSMRSAYRLEGVSDRILYLRDFHSDPSPWRHLLPWGPLKTPEEELGEVLQPVGELIAVGRPGSLQHPGAIQFYASEDEWRSAVAQQMAEAKLVLLRLGVGPGLMWELDTAMSVVPPDRLVILRLGIPEQEWHRVAEALEERIGTEFASMLPSGDGSRDGFIVFSRSRKATFLPLQSVPFWRRVPREPLARRFKYTLRPVLERFDCEWRQPPISKGRVALAAYLGLVAFSGLVFLALRAFGL